MSTVKKTYAKRSAPSKPNVVCCRACLATDGKLYNMHEHKLVDAFARVSGISSQQDKLPHYLCAYCAALLQRFTAFQAKCGRAQLWLLAGLMQKDFSMEYVRSIDRVANKLVSLMPSAVHTTNILPEGVKEIAPKEKSNEAHMGTSFGMNTKDNIDTSNDINTTHNLDIDKNNKTNVTIKYPDIYGLNVEDNECNIESELNDVDTTGDIDNGSQVEVVGAFIVKDIEEIVKETKNRSRIKMSRPKLTVEEKKARRLKRKEAKKQEIFRMNIAEFERKKTKQRSRIKISRPKLTVEEKKARRLKRKEDKKQEISRMNIAEFERKYNVKIVFLTMEQQLEEIEARKKSPKYLEATFRCEHCGRGFESEPVFRKHCKKYDPSAGEHVCSVCGARYRDRVMILEHQARHRTKVTCNSCGIVYRARQQARYHARMHDGQTFCCQHCGKMYNTKSAYLTHVRLRHPTAHVPCDMCGEGFLGPVGLRQHKRREHDVLSQGYSCPSCPTVFLTSAALQHHVQSAGERDHGALSACRWCGDTLGSEQLLDHHTAERHPTCDECCLTFLDAAALLTHHKRKHLGAFASNYNLKAPYAKKWQKQRPQPVMCEQCGKMQPCRAILVEHMRRHAGAPHLACRYDGCHKKFYKKYYLKQHEHRHVDQRPFQCDHCLRRFTLKPNLERHMLVIHLGKRLKVPCDICGRVFSTRGALGLHRRTVHGGEPHPDRNRATAKASSRLTDSGDVCED